MTDLITAVETWLKNLFTKWLSEAMPQIREAAREEILAKGLSAEALELNVQSYLDNVDWDVELEREIRKAVESEIGDLDDRFRDFINDHVSVEVSA